MNKIETNKQALEKFKSQLKNLKARKNGDEEMYGKVIFKWQDKSLEENAPIHFLSGHHDGKVLVIDENGTFKEVFVRFISNSQDYEVLTNGNLKISGTSEKPSIGNYEVLIEEI